MKRNTTNSSSHLMLITSIILFLVLLSLFHLSVSSEAHSLERTQMSGEASREKPFIPQSYLKRIQQLRRENTVIINEAVEKRRRSLKAPIEGAEISVAKKPKRYRCFLVDEDEEEALILASKNGHEFAAHLAKQPSFAEEIRRKNGAAFTIPIHNTRFVTDGEEKHSGYQNINKGTGVEEGSKSEEKQPIIEYMDEASNNMNIADTSTSSELLSADSVHQLQPPLTFSTTTTSTTMSSTTSGLTRKTTKKTWPNISIGPRITFKNMATTHKFENTETYNKELQGANREESRLAYGGDITTANPINTLSAKLRQIQLPRAQGIPLRNVIPQDSSIDDTRHQPPRVSDPRQVITTNIISEGQSGASSAGGQYSLLNAEDDPRIVNDKIETNSYSHSKVEEKAALATPRPQNNLNTVQISKDAQGRPLILSPEHCKLVDHYSRMYGVKDIRTFIHNNCAFAKMYLPTATCAEIDILVGSCFKNPD